MKSVELYEALKPHVGQEAAQMIAEVVPPAENLAIKRDIRALESRLLRWGLAAVIPMWVGVWGSLVLFAVEALRG